MVKYTVLKSEINDSFKYTVLAENKRSSAELGGQGHELNKHWCPCPRHGHGRGIGHGHGVFLKSWRGHGHGDFRKSWHGHGRGHGVCRKSWRGHEPMREPDAVKTILKNGKYRPRNDFLNN